MPEMPISDSAARTSSSLNGLMIAVISFMVRRLLSPVYSTPKRGHSSVCTFHA
jgi:hypothetical protein